MSSTDLSNYKNLYIKTAKEYVDKLLSDSLKLTSNPSDKEVINSLHINSHSLKSQSQVMGYMNVADICLNIEKISSDVLEGHVEFTNDDISNIKKSVEELGEMLKLIQHDTKAI